MRENYDNTIEQDIDIHEKDLDELLTFMDTPRRISKVIQHHIQREFSHVDWDCPRSEIRPQRLLDWITPVPLYDEPIPCEMTIFWEKQMERQALRNEGKVFIYKNKGEDISIVCTSTDEWNADTVASRIIYVMFGHFPPSTRRPGFHSVDNEIILKFDSSFSQDEILSYFELLRHVGQGPVGPPATVAVKGLETLSANPVQA
jgi:hypothetical protein